MEYIVTAPVALAAHPDKRTDMLNGIRDFLHSSDRNVSGHFDRNATNYLYFTIEAVTEEDAEQIALERTAQAARDAGYDVKPGLFVEIPVSKETLQAWQDQYEDALQAA